MVTEPTSTLEMPERLHCHGHADRADFAVWQRDRLRLRVPVNHLLDTREAAVERARGCGFAVVSGHDIALADEVLFTDNGLVDAEQVCQFADRGFDCKNALGCAVAAVCARRHGVGVYHVPAEAERLLLGIQRNRFVTGQAGPL